MFEILERALNDLPGWVLVTLELWDRWRRWKYKQSDDDGNIV